MPKLHKKVFSHSRTGSVFRGPWYRFKFIAAAKEFPMSGILERNSHYEKKIVSVQVTMLEWIFGKRE